MQSNLCAMIEPKRSSRHRRRSLRLVFAKANLQ